MVYVGSDLPTILRKQINRCAPHQLRICRTLRVRYRQAQKVIGIQIGRAGVIVSARTENIFAVYVEKQFLVKFLITNITAKLEAVVADDLAEVVVELKRVAGLRKLSFEVVPEQSLRAVERDERDAFKFRPEPRMNAASETGAVGSLSERRAVISNKR